MHNEKRVDAHTKIETNKSIKLGNKTNWMINFFISLFLCMEMRAQNAIKKSFIWSQKIWMHESIFIVKIVKKELNLREQNSPFQTSSHLTNLFTHSFSFLAFVSHSFLHRVMIMAFVCTHDGYVCRWINVCCIIQQRRRQYAQQPHHISGKIQLQYSTYNNSKRHQKFIVCTFIVKAM